MSRDEIQPSNTSDACSGSELQMDDMNFTTAISILQQCQRQGLNEAEIHAIRAIQLALPLPSSENYPPSDRFSLSRLDLGSSSASQEKDFGQHPPRSEKGPRLSSVTTMSNDTLLDLQEEPEGLQFGSDESEKVRIIQVQDMTKTATNSAISKRPAPPHSAQLLLCCHCNILKIIPIRNLRKQKMMEATNCRCSCERQTMNNCGANWHWSCENCENGCGNESRESRTSSSDKGELLELMRYTSSLVY